MVAEKRLTDALRRTMTTFANRYSKATADERSAKKEKVTCHDKLLDLMEEAGKTPEGRVDLAKLAVLIVQKGGTLDYELARQLLDAATLEALTDYVIDTAKAEEVLDEVALAKIRVPVLSMAKAKKHLDKDKITSITLEGSTTTSLQVLPIRQEGDRKGKR